MNSSMVCNGLRENPFQEPQPFMVSLKLFERHLSTLFARKKNFFSRTEGTRTTVTANSEPSIHEMEPAGRPANCWFGGRAARQWLAWHCRHRACRLRLGHGLLVLVYTRPRMKSPGPESSNGRGGLPRKWPRLVSRHRRRRRRSGKPEPEPVPVPA
jgi:hypothetical protein